LGIVIESMRKIIPVGGSVKLKHDLSASINSHGGGDAKRRMAGKYVILAAYETNKIIVRESKSSSQKWTILEGDIEFDIHELENIIKKENVLFNLNNLDL